MGRVYELSAMAVLALSFWLVRRDAKRKGRALSPICSVCDKELGVLQELMGQYAFVGNFRQHLLLLPLSVLIAAPHMVCMALLKKRVGIAVRVRKAAK